MNCHEYKLCANIAIAIIYLVACFSACPRLHNSPLVSVPTWKKNLCSSCCWLMLLLFVPPSNTCVDDLKFFIRTHLFVTKFRLKPKRHSHEIIWFSLSVIFLQNDERKSHFLQSILRFVLICSSTFFLNKLIFTAF